MNGRTLVTLAAVGLFTAFALALVELRESAPTPEPQLEGAETRDTAERPPAATESSTAGSAGEVIEMQVVIPRRAWSTYAAASRAAAAAGMHAELLGMSESGRNALLRLVVTDANYPCEAVSSASALDELPLWRVSCAGAHFYSVTIDERQDFHVEPMQWDAPTPRPPFSEGRSLEIVPAPER